MSCGSTANCVAVGYAQNNAIGGLRPEAAVWNGHETNGKAWTIEQPPAGSAPPSMDSADSCTGAFCLEIGTAEGSGNTLLLASYDATAGQWHDQSAGLAVPSRCGRNCFPPGSLACGSPVNCMEFSRYATLAWNGTGLKPAPSVSAGRGSLLGAVSCGTSFCMAVGHKTVKGKIRPLAELWNGATWTIIKTP